MSAMIDWSSCSALEQDPSRVSGAWVFRGTRVPVAALLVGRRLAVGVLSTTSWPRIRPVTAKVLDAVESARPGSFIEVGVE